MPQAEPSITIRAEMPGDAAAVATVLEQAFGGTGEVELVAALRQHGAVVAALVAIADGQVVGHILFSPITITFHVSRMERWHRSETLN